MYKYLIAVLLGLAGLAKAEAQNMTSMAGISDKLDSVKKEIFDVARIQAHYEYQEKRSKNSDRVTAHQMLLFIREKYLRYTSMPAYQADTLIDNAYKRGVTSYLEIMPAHRATLRADKSNESLLLNLVEQKIRAEQEIVTTKYIYEEALPQQEWQLTEGDSTILGYACKRAETSFRGRKYVAWYAPELELPYGPWKFGGLPGLIFDVVDSEGEHRHTLRGLEALSVYTPIYWEPSEPRRTKTGYKREEVWKIAYNYAKDPAAYLRQLEGVRFEEKDLQEMKPRPYNPQELE